MTARTIPLVLLTAFAVSAPTPASAQETAFAVLENDATFSTLVAAIRAAGLEAQLSGEGPITIFAPTNDAFAKLPAGELEAMLADPAALASILKLHVVGEEVRASAIQAESLRLPTLGDGELLVAMEDDEVVVQPAPAPAREVVAGEEEGEEDPTVATVQRTDLTASNGVIHAIDTVLIAR